MTDFCIHTANIYLELRIRSNFNWRLQPLKTDLMYNIRFLYEYSTADYFPFF